MAPKKLFGTADDLRNDDQLSSTGTISTSSDGFGLENNTKAFTNSNSGDIPTLPHARGGVVDVGSVSLPPPGSATIVPANTFLGAGLNSVSTGLSPDDDVHISPIPGNDLHADLVQAAALMRLDQVRANPLFAGVDGHGETVVIIDSGADLDHPFFGPDADHNGVDDRILFQFDFSGSNDSDASDGNGHGTHVTGIVGSQDSTYKGMAPGTTFIILKVLDNTGHGNTTDIAEAFQWVVDHRTTFPNIVAVSMSIGVTSNFNSDQATAISGQVQTLWNAGIATVIAAGNDYSSFNSPGVQSLAATANAWGVASTLDNANTFSSFSQRSNTMTEIAAPGSDITSSYLNGGTNTLSGTSMATPMISGLVALAQDLSQEISGSRMTPTSILNIMRSTGVNITDGTTTVPRVDALNLMNGIVSFWQQSTNNPDNIYGWRGDDNLSGQGGDDTIRGNLGNDTIDGGAGTDRAIFAGLRSAYTLTPLSGNGVRVSGPDGIDTLTNVERLVFDDQTLIWPPPDTTAPSLVHKGPMAVTAGATASITSSLLQFDDSVSTHAQETYTITTTPVHGTLAKNGVAATSFTQADIDNGLIAYHEDDRSVTSDFFVFKVTDAAGNQTSTQQFNFNVSQPAGAFAAVTTPLGAFGSSNAAGGWASNNTYPRVVGDINGDGMADIVGFGGAGVTVSLATGGGRFGTPALAIGAFGTSNSAGGWASDDLYPRVVGDVNGDGMADIVGFGIAGATVSLATGGGHFATPFLSISAFGTSNGAGGWASNDQFPRELADVNGDGLADIVGFGNGGVNVSLATGGGQFAASFLSLGEFGNSNGAGGWVGEDQFPRHLADVNGDGLADIVGFGGGGVNVSLATGGGHFAASFLSLGQFGASNGAGGWTSDHQFPREVADVNGDGLADIVAFGTAGAIVSLATGGGHFGASSLALGTFDAAGGWTSNDLNPRVLGDVNGDGSADIVGFNSTGVNLSLATAAERFEVPSLVLTAFGNSNVAGGWASNDQFPRELADVNGDGMADIIGFGNGGVNVSLATGGGHFAASALKLAAFGATAAAGNWASDNGSPREMADVNHDGLADIVGFNSAGVNVALATGGGNFAAPFLSLAAFGSSAGAGSWTNNDQFPRELADVNGDGMADIVGFNGAGVNVALATGGGHFATSSLALGEFGSSNGAGGWASDNLFPREVADVNGDGMADIIGFGGGGVSVALATGGGHFAASSLVTTAFGTSNAAGGWTSQTQYPREVADLNGDGRADIIGFGSAGVTIALGQRDGSFTRASFDIPDFGAAAAAGGWASDNLYPRLVADVTGDHKADIVGFGIAGVTVSAAHDFLLF